MAPAPGTHLVRHVGDRLSVRVDMPGSMREGDRAFLRTNLTRGEIARRETIALLGRMPEDEATFAGASWRDIALERRSDGFAIDLPLLEVGHFRAKAYVVDARGHQAWPEGADLGISVHPAHARTANVIYCAFPRNFGATKRAHRALSDARSAQLRPLDDQGYTVIPPSGTLRDLVAEIPHVVDRLGCRILHLLPIGPVPTTHARMGRFGSPYAQLDLTAIDPHVVVFDRRTTGVDQFREVADAMHARGGLVFLDVVVNHTGWRSTLQEEHPEWFRRDPAGAFHSPGAWGNTWADLVELDHRDPALWGRIAEALLEWCRRGVDGFRCDAAYMVPLPAWQYLVARVRQEFPDTIFLAEGLGGAWEATEALLAEGGMQWAYSELFQNFEPAQVESYLDHAFAQSARVGVLVHYSETHDNDRLAKRGREHSLFRNRLCALTSVSGAFGFTSGVEWLAEEKIDVHEATGLSFGTEPNLVEELGRLGHLLAHHPCFFDGASLARVSPPGSPVLVVARASADGCDHGLVVANLDAQATQTASVPLDVWRRGGEKRFDLLGAALPPVELATDGVRLEVPPYACVFLVARETPLGTAGDEYRRARDAEGFALEALAAVLPQESIGPADHRALAAIVLRDPERFVGSIHAIDPAAARRDLASAIEAAIAEVPFSNVVSIAPSDRPRVTLVPPNAFVLARDSLPFRIRRTLPDGSTRERRSVALDGVHAAVLPPIPIHEGALDVAISMRLFGAKTEEREATLRYVAERPAPPDPAPRGLALLTNGRGGMARIHSDPAHVESKYDALLAANLHPSAPSERHVLAKRARVWVIADGFLTSLGRATLLAFEPGPPARWRFAANAGDGRRVALRMTAWMPGGENTTVLRFERERGSIDLGPTLPDGAEVRLTVRIDLEDRSFHAETRRSPEAEAHFASSIERLEGAIGFDFAPAVDRRLRVTSSGGHYHEEPEWTYTTHPLEATRGLVAEGDAYSPGWFELELHAGGAVTLVATAEESSRAIAETEHESAPRPHEASSDLFAARLRSASRAFLARRGGGRTVIAGFPWFLDWGRDSLIAVRGLVTAGFHEETRSILRTYAALERDGTLPNALSADSTRDRDTSDAPLLFALACGDAARHLGDGLFTEPLEDGRTIDEVLVSIARSYVRGCPNGVILDPDSGLPFSPPHFTWMDTNHPAGTPREGYPIELAALFIRLLDMLEARRLGAAIPGLEELRGRAAASLALFARDDLGFLADTLHAPRGVSAARARPDDHLRPNMLVAIALGLVRGERARAAVTSAARHLVVPGAVRSLAPRAVAHELPIRTAWGELLGDPRMPYRGRYEGDEDRCRKPAYHNGTAWVFPLATYAEALVAAWEGAEQARRAARATLASAAALLDVGAIGHLPEILDGDAPHAPRGCDAQAWSATEILRVWTALR